MSLTRHVLDSIIRIDSLCHPVSESIRPRISKYFSSLFNQFVTSAINSSNSSRPLPLVLHSHTTKTRQFCPNKRSLILVSRARLVLIFVSQNSRFVAGTLNKWQSCPCQKQPLTNTTALSPRNTKSGFPAKFLS